MIEEFGPDDLLTAKQAGIAVGYDHRTIISWIHNGWLPAVKGPGSRGRYKIRYQDLIAVANRPYKPRKDPVDES